MNLPNKLTLFRIFLIPVFILVMLSNIPSKYLIACLIFIAASITDAMDGHIARKYNLVTDFGKFLDPIADKALTTAAYIIFCFEHIGTGIEWVLFIVLLREFVVTSVRLAAADSGKVVAANIYGKIKTVAQMITIGTITFFMGVLREFRALMPREIFIAGVKTFEVGSSALLWISAILTLIAGVTYIIDNKEFINSNK